MKGSLFDTFGVLLYVFIGGVVLLFLFYILAEFETTVSAIPMFASNDVAMDTLNQGQNVIQGMDGLFAFAIFMTCALTLVAAYLAPVHPILFITFLFMSIILIPISTELANAFEAIYSTGPLSGTEANFPVTLLVFEWLPKITVLLSTLTAVVMYMFGGNRGGVGY
jgi:hypothetical protein